MNPPLNFNRFSQAWIMGYVAIAIVFWAYYILLIGVESSDFALFTMISAFYFISATSRKIFVVFAPFFIYLMFYNSLRVLSSINPFPVHIEDVYNLELKWFGINVDGVRMTLNEYFIENTSLFLDLLSGMSYITWVPFPILFAFYMIYRKRSDIAFNYWTAFLLANLFGFVGYVTYPAAPPWYYMEYGNEFFYTVPGNAAGLARFDDLMGITMYRSMYSQGAYTFGAVPSMHAAFPLILVYYARKYGNKLLTTLFTISLLGIWVGAVYTSHHYVLDVFLGILCGIMGLIITELIVNRKFVPKWHSTALAYIR